MFDTFQPFLLLALQILLPLGLVIFVAVIVRDFWKDN